MAGLDTLGAHRRSMVEVHVNPIRKLLARTLLCWVHAMAAISMPKYGPAGVGIEHPQHTGRRTSNFQPKGYVFLPETRGFTFDDLVDLVNPLQHMYRTQNSLDDKFVSCRPA